VKSSIAVQRARAPGCCVSSVVALSRRRNRQVEGARAQLKQLPADDPTGPALGQVIDVPPGERYWTALDAIDWLQRQVPGIGRSICERGLVPTSHRLLVARPGGIEAIDFHSCERFGYRKLGMQGIVIAANSSHRWEFSTHWAAAEALVELINTFRDRRLQSSLADLHRRGAELDRRLNAAELTRDA